MNSSQSEALLTLLAKEEIRELVLLYSRGVDRKDGELLRTLYTVDATDTHGDTFDGPAGQYVDFLEGAFPFMHYSGHHVCNHLISVNGDTAEGEVYAITYHVIPDGKGGWMEDLLCVRYLDHYRKDSDERWRFAQRVVTYDYNSRQPIAAPDEAKPAVEDSSYQVLTRRLFNRGNRA